MAHTTITHTCGHQTQVQMYGPMADRDRRAANAAAYDCPACRARASDLTGSEKQVAWANDIRAALSREIIAKHDKAADIIAAAPARPDVPDFEERRATILAALETERDRLLARKAARDWIDTKSDDGWSAYMAIVRAGGRA